MDFDLYIRKSELCRTVVYWFKYIAVFHNTERNDATLRRYKEKAELADVVDVSLNAGQQLSLDNCYRKASKTEAAKFLLLAKNEHNKKS